MPDEPRQILDGVRPHENLVMLAAHGLGDQAGVFELAVGALGEAHARRHQRPVRLTSHGGYHCRRVDAAAQKCSEGDIGHHTDSNRLVEDGREGLEGFLRARRTRGPEVHVPVFVKARPSALPDEEVGRRYLIDALEHRARARNVPEGEIVAARLEAQPALDALILQ